jgi:phage gp37-like protein
MYTTEEIEDAAISALDPLKSTLGVRTLKSYQGELEEEDVKRLIALFPAIYVVYGGSRFVTSGRRVVETMTWHFFVCDKNLRSEEEARKGSVRNPGTYAMLIAIRGKLGGQQLSMEIQPFKPIRQQTVWFDGGISIYSADYEMSQSLLLPETD